MKSEEKELIMNTNCIFKQKHIQLTRIFISYSGKKEVIYMSGRNNMQLKSSRTYSFNFIKLDGNTTERLANAVFELRDNELVIATAISDEFGNVTFEGIKSGKYTLHETIPPEGYSENKDIYTVCVRGCNLTTINKKNYKKFIVKNYPLELYTLEYNPNGVGTDEPIYITVPAGTEIFLLWSPFESVINDFMHWNTESDGSGNIYGQEIYVMNKDIVLYARWRSLRPNTNYAYEGDIFFSGTGDVPGALIRSTFPKGAIAETTVAEDGTWVMDVPESEKPLTRAPREYIRTVQIEPNMFPSIDRINAVLARIP